jgi:hypothetical protein
LPHGWCHTRRCCATCHLWSVSPSGSADHQALRDAGRR